MYQIFKQQVDIKLRLHLKIKIKSNFQKIYLINLKLDYLDNILGTKTIIDVFIASAFIVNFSLLFKILNNQKRFLKNQKPN